MSKFLVLKILFNFPFVFVTWMTCFVVIATGQQHGDSTVTKTTDTPVAFKYMTTGDSESYADRSEREEQTSRSASELNENNETSTGHGKDLYSDNSYTDRSKREEQTSRSASELNEKNETSTGHGKDLYSDSVFMVWGSSGKDTPAWKSELRTSVVNVETESADSAGATTGSPHDDSIGTTLRSDGVVSKIYSPPSAKVRNALLATPSSDEWSTTVVVSDVMMTDESHSTASGVKLSSLTAEKTEIMTSLNRAKRSAASSLSTPKLVDFSSDGKNGTALLPSVDELTTAIMLSDGTTEVQSTEASDGVQSNAAYDISEPSTTAVVVDKPVPEVSKERIEVKTTTRIEEAMSQKFHVTESDKMITDESHESSESALYTLEHDNSTSAPLLSSTFAALTVEDSASTPGIDFTSEMSLSTETWAPGISQNFSKLIVAREFNETISIDCVCSEQDFKLSCRWRCSQNVSAEESSCAFDDVQCECNKNFTETSHTVNSFCRLWNPTGSFDDVSTSVDFYNTDRVVTQSTVGEVPVLETTLATSPESSTVVTTTKKLECKKPVSLNVFNMGAVLFLSWNQPDICRVFHIYLNESEVEFNCSWSNTFVNCSLILSKVLSPGELLQITVFVGMKSDNVSQSKSYVMQPAIPQNLKASVANHSLCFNWTQEGFYDHFQVTLSLSESSNHFMRYDNIYGSKSPNGKRVMACINYNHSFCAASQHQIQLKAYRYQKPSETSDVSFYYSAPNPPLIGCYDETHSSFRLNMTQNPSKGCPEHQNNMLQPKYTYQYLVLNDFKNIISSVSDSTTVKITVQEAGTTYQVEAWTTVNGVQSDSNSVECTTEPAAPQDLKASVANHSLCFNWMQEGSYDHFQVTLSLSGNNSHFMEYDDISGSKSPDGKQVMACINYNHSFCAASKHQIQLKANRYQKTSDASNVSFYYSAPNSPMIRCYDQTNSSFRLEMKQNSSKGCVNNMLPQNYTYLYLVMADSTNDITSVNDNQTADVTVATNFTNPMKNILSVSDNTTVIITVQDAGTTYQVEVWTTVNGVQSDSNSVECTTVPNPPSGIEISDVTATTASLTWSPPKGRVHEYFYHCRRISDTEYYQSQRIEGLKGAFKNLTPGEIYSAAVRSCLEEEKNISSADSDTVLFITEPLPPENVIFVNSTNNTAELMVDYNGNKSRCTGFRLIDHLNRTHLCSVENVNCQLLRLQSNQQYKISVYAVSSYENVSEKISSQSSYATFWTRPDRVSGMNLSSPNHTSLEVTWIGLSNVDVYNIEIRNSTGWTLWTVEHKCTAQCGNERSHVFSSLSSRTNYTISLRAVNKGGPGEALEDSEMTLEEMLPPGDSNIFIIISGSGLGVCCLLVVFLLSVFFYRQRPKFAVPSSKRPSDAAGFTNPSFIHDIDSKEAFERMKPNPIPFENFISHLETLHDDSDLNFSSEYALLQGISPKFSQTAAELEDNRIKNRYSNILPFDHSRVKLIPLDEDDPCSDYINANYMPGFSSKREFIAAQGPMKSTVDDFWRMIWEQHITTIVMVTNLQERGREKCADYWPMEDEPIFYGDLQVQMISESQLNYYIIRVLEVKLGEKKRTIKHLHFIAWPDFGCPENTAVLLDFVTGVRSHMSSPSSQNSGSGPILVHCSAGVGRTGTFILVDRLLQHIRNCKTIDIFGLVLEMRNYRCNMIQTESQYIFAHECIKTAIERQMESNYFDEADENEDESLYQNVSSRGVGVPREDVYQNANQIFQTVVEMESAGL